MDTSSNKPKTVAQIDVNIVPRINKSDWLRETLEEHFHCVLCGTPLVFTHKTDFVAQQVTENAHCPACQVRNRQSCHRLQ